MAAPIETTPEHQEVQFTKRAPLETGRNTVRYQPINSNNILGRLGEKIKIVISDSRSLLDLAHSYFLIKLSASQTGGTDVRFNNYAASAWIRSIRVQTSGQEIEMINDYNIFHKSRGEMFFSKEYKDGIYGQDQQGIGNAATLKTWATNGKQFAFQPLGFLASSKYLALPLLSNIEIEIEMESPENFLTFDGTAPTYTLEYIRYLGDLVTIGDASMKSMMSKASSEGVVLHYNTYQTLTKPTPVGTQDSIELGTFRGSIKDVKFFQVLDVDRNEDDEEYLPSFKINNLSRYNIRLGHKNLREDQVDISSTEFAEATTELLKSEHLYGNISVGAEDITDFSVRAMFGQQVDVSRNPDTINSVEELFNNAVTLDVRYSTTPGVGTIYAHVHTDRKMTMLGGRLVRVD